MRQEKMLYKYLIAALIGMLLGYRILPPIITAMIFGGLMLTFIIHAGSSKVEKAFLVLPFIVYGEIYFRGHARAYLPFLSVQYMFIIGFSLLLINTKFSRDNFHFKPIGLLVIFYIIEILNGFFPEKAIITRGIQVNTLAVVIPAVWASFHKFSPILINKMMDNIRIATVLLAGVVLVAHLQGKIDYNTASNSDASSNMAPVQLSGYLGLGSILFLISILNQKDKRSKIIQSFTFVVITTLMVLTFSRGGLYFVAVIAMIYMFFNRANFGSYFKFIIFIPVAIIIYNFVVDKTDGKIIDRYEAKGASNREQLVAIGFLIYAQNPIIGIGTGNYNTYIKRKKLFGLESGAHNEFARVAAEHGTIGIIFYWGFFIALIFTILKRSKPAKEYAMYFLVLFILITIHNGLKISVQPFVLIFAIAIAPISYSSKQVKHVTASLQRA
ncbi:MAG: O-antigen ligase family protein [Chitinophagaceae bacterium]|jgi:O-antigen ligase|nr:O-antigen ligase family protein [Chitinophagaceae bacterium]